MSITYGKKFQGQKINLPTCVFVGKNGGKPFIATNFDTLPTVEKLSIYHEMFGTALSL
jgi:hypothetical protein